MRKVLLPEEKTSFAHAESLPDYLRQKDLCLMYWQLEGLFPLGHSGKTAKKMFVFLISTKEMEGLVGGAVYWCLCVTPSQKHYVGNPAPMLQMPVAPSAFQTVRISTE